MLSSLNLSVVDGDAGPTPSCTSSNTDFKFLSSDSVHEQIHWEEHKSMIIGNLNMKVYKW
jgi:hypothetical protein